MNNNENNTFQVGDDVVIRGRSWQGAGRIKELLPLPHCNKAKVAFHYLGKEEITVTDINELRKLDLWH